jgi:hypothetical protein
MQRLGKHISVTTEELLGNDVFCWIRPGFFNEDQRPAECELKESLEKAVEDD